MEGDITPVLANLDDCMKKMEMGSGVPDSIQDYTPSSDITGFEKKWEGEI